MKLHAFACGQQDSNVSQGNIIEDSQTPQIAFLFTGQGAQYEGMGRTLYETEPMFRQILNRCSRILRSSLQLSLIDIIYLTETSYRDQIHQTNYTQPALFALEYAVATLWHSMGSATRYPHGTQRWRDSRSLFCWCV